MSSLASGLIITARDNVNITVLISLSDLTVQQSGWFISANIKVSSIFAHSENFSQVGSDTQTLLVLVEAVTGLVKVQGS